MMAASVAFPADSACSLVRRLEFRHAPKHGSWLNIAENELRSMTRRCLNGRRIGNIETLRNEMTARYTASDHKQRGSQIAIPDRRCSFEIEVPLSQIRRLTWHSKTPNDSFIVRA